MVLTRLLKRGDGLGMEDSARAALQRCQPVRHLRLLEADPVVNTGWIPGTYVYPDPPRHARRNAVIAVSMALLTAGALARHRRAA